MTSHNPLTGGNYAPFGDPRAVLVDSLIGSAYRVVEYVARHINEVQHVSNNLESIYELSLHVEAIQNLVENLDPIKEINENIEDLKHIYREIDDLVALAQNVPAIYAINENIDNINNLYAHIDAIELVGPNIAEILRVNHNLDNILRAERVATTKADEASASATSAKTSEDNARLSATASATSANLAKSYAESIDSPVLYKPMPLLTDEEKRIARANIEAFRIPYGGDDQYLDGKGVPHTLTAWSVGLENVANKNEWELATTGPIAQLLGDRIEKYGDSNIGFMESALDVMGNTGDYTGGIVTPAKNISNYKIMGNNSDFTLAAPASGSYTMVIYIWPSPTAGNMAVTGFDYMHGVFDKGNLNVITIVCVGSNKWIHISKGS